MTSISETLVAYAPMGKTVALPRAGTALENPFVYDSVASDIKQYEKQGRVEVVAEQSAAAGSEAVVWHLEFRRLR